MCTETCAKIKCPVHGIQLERTEPHVFPCEERCGIHTILYAENAVERFCAICIAWAESQQEEPVELALDSEDLQRFVPQQQDESQGLGLLLEAPFVPATAVTHDVSPSQSIPAQTDLAGLLSDPFVAEAPFVPEAPCVPPDQFVPQDQFANISALDIYPELGLDQASGRGLLLTEPAAQLPSDWDPAATCDQAAIASYLGSIPQDPMWSGL